MKKQMQKDTKILQLIKNNINENLKEYLIVSLFLLIGIIIGVVFINNLNDEQKISSQEYILQFINELNTNSKIDKLELAKVSIINNLLIVLILWFIGSTVIGIPILCIVIGAQGFCLGYTISTIMISFGLFKGILFTIMCLLLQNIIFIPCIIAVAVSGIKVYKSIMKDKRKINIKIEIIRHTIFSLIASLILIISSVIETYISSNLLMHCAKIFI